MDKSSQSVDYKFNMHDDNVSEPMRNSFQMSGEKKFAENKLCSMMGSKTQIDLKKRR